MIIALHGFLGLAQDWAPFEGVFADKHGRPEVLRKWNLYADIPDLPPRPGARPMRLWAEQFCHRLRSAWKVHGRDETHRPVLLGYSLGGRLALHALLRDPGLWGAAVIIGAHPGLSDTDMILQRRLNDAQWAERFRHEEWSTLIRAWGEQDVFRTTEREGGLALRRMEGDFDRIALSRAMRIWSLAEQEDLRSELAKIRIPTLWLHGREDRRFAALYGELKDLWAANPAHRFAEIPEASHRVPWENPSEFVLETRRFLSELF